MESYDYHHLMRFWTLKVTMHILARHGNHNFPLYIFHSPFSTLPIIRRNFNRTGGINPARNYLAIIRFLKQMCIINIIQAIIRFLKQMCIINIIRKLHESAESAAYHSVGREPYVIKVALSLSAVGAT